jgi:hypothetical protein
MGKRYDTPEERRAGALASRRKHQSTPEYKAAEAVRRKHGCKHDPLKWIHRRIRQRAKDDGTVFTMTIEDLEAIWTGKCAVFGNDIVLAVTLNKEDRPDNKGMASVDRVDPDRGYERGNIQWISFYANQIKNCGTRDEHLIIADYMDRNLEKEKASI